MSRSTEDLIRELAGDLPPVKPMARVRAVMALVAGASLPFYAWWFVSHGLRHQFVEGQAPGAIYLLAALVLVILAVGGMVCALTSAIPGRERDARAGQLVFGSGVLIATGLLLVFGFVDETPMYEGLMASRGCIQGSLMLAIPAGLIVVGYVMRGAARSLSTALAVGFTGGTGMAAIVVHLTCPHPEPLHMVIGHAAVPLYAGIVLMALASAFAAIRGRGDRRDPASR